MVSLRVIARRVILVCAGLVFLGVLVQTDSLVSLTALAISAVAVYVIYRLAKEEMEHLRG